MGPGLRSLGAGGGGVWTGRVQAPGEGVKLQTGSTKPGRGQRRQKRAWGCLPKLPFPHPRDLAPSPLAWSESQGSKDFKGQGAWRAQDSPAELLPGSQGGD